MAVIISVVETVGLTIALLAVPSLVTNSITILDALVAIPIDRNVKGALITSTATATGRDSLKF